MFHVEEISFTSRRSPVLARKGIVASSQPLATTIGVNVLRKGGNAADAAVAVAAALNVTEPTSTGIGGDAFCIFFDNKTKKVHGLNGSGRSSSQLSLGEVRKRIGGNRLPNFDALTVTVPGAAAAWEETVNLFGSGKFTLLDVLTPAIELAEEGYPVGPITACSWSRGKRQLDLSGPTGSAFLTSQGNTPQCGELIRLPDLGKTFRELGMLGARGFYEGRIGRAIVEKVLEHGGCLAEDDLMSHRTEQVEPISVSFDGYKLWELPPNGQGLVALIALNILNFTHIRETKFLSADALHLQIEALRLAFADAYEYVGDPEHVKVPVEALTSEDYGRSRAGLISETALKHPVAGSPSNSTDTVYFTAVDKDGNACSFINSNYMGFGTGLVPEGCGFTLQNRGANFNLKEGHPNCIGPKKRPYHTIIPGLITKDSELFASMGVMGGFMQPQGHVQVFLAMILWGCDPQTALDAPRFCIGPGHEGAIGSVSLESGLHESVLRDLRRRGHPLDGPIISVCLKFIAARAQIGQYLGEARSLQEMLQPVYAPVNTVPFGYGE